MVMRTDADNVRHPERPRRTVDRFGRHGQLAVVVMSTAGGERTKFVARPRTCMPLESEDPRTVDVLVVHADDVVAALAATAQGRETVLRVTPPFRGRQRARIHVVESVDGADGQPGGGATDDDARTRDVADGIDAADAGPVQRADGAEATDPLHVPADAFVADDAPSFPRAPETEPTPAESPEYDVDEHFERHEDAVADWRSTIAESFRDRTRTEAPGGERCEFEVRYLGG